MSIPRDRIHSDPGYFLLSTRFPSQDCILCRTEQRRCLWMMWGLGCLRCIVIGHRDCDYINYDNWFAHFTRERAGLLTQAPVANPSVVAQLDSDNTTTEQAFIGMRDIDLIGPDGSILRNALSQTTMIRELHNLLKDAIAYSRPSFIIDVLRERLEALCAERRMVLPADMRSS
ncbi:hypothetical protein C8R46DRAFT_1104566 [Mycena filopes]|nr:hypothetical protein C8R46DRAFT_1104566 [Mycena filopes]